MTTYTFTVMKGATLLQLNKQTLEQCMARVAVIRSTYPDALHKIVLTLDDGKTIEIEQEKS